MNAASIILALALALVGSIGANLYQWRDCAVEKAKAVEQANTRAAAAEAAAQESARQAEAATESRVDAVATAYEKGKTDAEATGADVLAAQRAGDLRLRDIWQGAATRCLSTLGDATGQLDAARRDREASASRIVRAAAQADAKIAGLQAFIRAERAPPGAPH